jgi:predicted amidohydrolase
MPSKGKIINRRGLRIAAVQMDANPAPTGERLARAERLVYSAVDAGAQLIVLPELFNIGYSYSDENHARVEAIDGRTAAWMRITAARHDIHLAGSLMLLDHGDVYNVLLLFGPDGQVWRYDKNYPWGWERGSFRESRRVPRVTVAKTDLGDIGLLVCWDVAHLDLWAAYAGRVDLMLICSSPPDIGEAVYHFPDGDRLTLDDIGRAAKFSKGNTLRVFGDMINQQTAWLGVPAVNSVGCGHIRTEIPNGRLSLIGYGMAAPWMFKYLPQADRMQLSCDMVHMCKIIAANGQVLTRIHKQDGESFALAEVDLPESKPARKEAQPASPIPKRTYILSDVILPMITKSVYRKGQRYWRKLND